MEKGKVKFIRKNGRIIPVRIDKNFKDKKEVSHLKHTDRAAGAMFGAGLFLKPKKALFAFTSAMGLSAYGGIKRYKAYKGDHKGMVNSVHIANKHQVQGAAVGAGAATFGAAGLIIARHQGVFKKLGSKLGDFAARASDAKMGIKNKVSPLKKKTNLSKFTGKTYKAKSRKLEKVQGLLSYGK